MYPLGHMVSEMSSTVILGRGCALLWAVQNRRGRIAAHVKREEALSSMQQTGQEYRLREAARGMQ